MSVKFSFYYTMWYYIIYIYIVRKTLNRQQQMKVWQHLKVSWFGNESNFALMLPTIAAGKIPQKEQLCRSTFILQTNQAEFIEICNQAITASYTSSISIFVLVQFPLMLSLQSRSASFIYLIFGSFLLHICNRYNLWPRPGYSVAAVVAVISQNLSTATLTNCPATI